MSIPAAEHRPAEGARLGTYSASRQTDPYEMAVTLLKATNGGVRLENVGGDGPQGALESIMLNAGALALNAGVAEDWPAALKLAADAMGNGEPVRLEAINALTYVPDAKPVLPQIKAAVGASVSIAMRNLLSAALLGPED